MKIIIVLVVSLTVESWGLSPGGIAAMWVELKLELLQFGQVWLFLPFCEGLFVKSCKLRPNLGEAASTALREKILIGLQHRYKFMSL
jgi:hypothetical protein